MEELSITVSIADRSYRLKVDKHEEESVKKAVKLIDQKIKEYAGSYTFQDKQDLLAMVALQFTSSLQNVERQLNGIDQENIERLRKLDSFLSAYLREN